MQHAEQVDVEQILKILVAVIQKRFGAVDAGVVDQNVDAPPLSLHTFHRLHTGLTIPHVNGQRHHPRGVNAPGPLQGVQLDRIGGHQRHSGTFLDIRLGDGAANATARARDESNLIV